MELEFLLLGEAADNPNGKLYVMAGWSQIHSAMFPTVARCGIAVSVIVPCPMTEPVSIHIRYSNNDKTISMDINGQVQPGRSSPGLQPPEQQRIFFVLNANFPVPKPGKHFITATLPNVTDQNRDV